MKPITCTEALQLLEQGWDEGVGSNSLKTMVNHLATCHACAATAAGWVRAERLLAEFSAAVDRSLPRRSLTDRVSQVLLSERDVATDPIDRVMMEEADLARFLARLQQDAGLRQRATASVERQTLVDALVMLAAESGLHFTASTVQSALGKARAANDGELSDEQLEAVAGGASQQLVWFQEWVSGLHPPPREK